MLCALKASMCLFAVTVQAHSQDSAWYPHTGSTKCLTETLWNYSLRELRSFQSPCILFCLVNTKIAQMCILCSGQCTVTKASLLFENVAGSVILPAAEGGHISILSFYNLGWACVRAYVCASVYVCVSMWGGDGTRKVEWKWN